tara:strand:- start:462 stop:641 length:180 start_codon:yes stop_codon:yes gene_type:complete
MYDLQFEKIKMRQNRIFDGALNVLFKAIGGLFRSMVLMGNKNDSEKLIGQLITNPTKKV